MTERKQWGGEPEANNLVYTKRRKDIYAISTHETTVAVAVVTHVFDIVTVIVLDVVVAVVSDDS